MINKNVLFVKGIFYYIGNSLRNWLLITFILDHRGVLFFREDKLVIILGIFKKITSQYASIFRVILPRLTQNIQRILRLVIFFHRPYFELIDMPFLT